MWMWSYWSMNTFFLFTNVHSYILNKLNKILTWFTVDPIDYIGPWWTCLVDTGYVIGLLWQGMVCKQVTPSTESNSGTGSLNPVELSTMICEHSVWVVTISGHYNLEIILLNTIDDKYKSMQKANNINTGMHKIHGLITMKLIYVYNIYIIIDHYYY